jgi:hypothetical protein
VTLKIQATKGSRKGAKAQRRESATLMLNGFFRVFLCAFAPLREISLFRFSLALLLLMSLASCNAEQKQVGIPPAAQATIDGVTADIAAENDDKIYRAAAEEWRQASTIEQSREFFKTLRAKLGGIKGRTFHTARAEQNAGSAQPEQTLIVQYQTNFERATGMETFTLVEREGRWQLARYFVNSEALK